MIHNIFLVGPMGAGKTTIGRQLAQTLNRSFFDSDAEIEQRTGVDIPLIFHLEQEEGFRKREKKVIDELSQLSNIVLATGGGAILDPQNRQFLSSRGFVVYLVASLDQLMSRTQKDQNRPLLNQTQDPRQWLEEMMQIRDPLYRSIADLLIETDEAPMRSVVSRIIEQVNRVK